MAESKKSLVISKIHSLGNNIKISLSDVQNSFNSQLQVIGNALKNVKEIDLTKSISYFGWIQKQIFKDKSDKRSELMEKIKQLYRKYFSGYLGENKIYLEAGTAGIELNNIFLCLMIMYLSLSIIYEIYKLKLLAQAQGSQVQYDSDGERSPGVIPPDPVFEVYMGFIEIYRGNWAEGLHKIRKNIWGLVHIGTTLILIIALLIRIWVFINGDKVNNPVKVNLTGDLSIDIITSVTKYSEIIS